MIVGKRRRKSSLETKGNRTGGRGLGVTLYGRTEGRVRDKSGLSSQRCEGGRLGSEAVWRNLIGVGFDMCGKEGEVRVGLGAEGVRH